MFTKIGTVTVGVSDRDKALDFYVHTLGFKVEAVLRQITNPRDRALFWLIYDGGLRCQEALVAFLVLLKTFQHFSSQKGYILTPCCYPEEDV